MKFAFELIASEKAACFAWRVKDPMKANVFIVDDDANTLGVASTRLPPRGA
jgi:hypothetical protein